GHLPRGWVEGQAGNRARGPSRSSRRVFRRSRRVFTPRAVWRGHHRRCGSDVADLWGRQNVFGIPPTKQGLVGVARPLLTGRSGPVRGRAAQGGTARRQRAPAGFAPGGGATDDSAAFPALNDRSIVSFG